MQTQRDEAELAITQATQALAKAIKEKLEDVGDIMPPAEYRLKDDVCLAGMIHWQDMAKQLSTVWWEVSKVGGTLQHGDLDEEGTMFSIVLAQHGGKCFHGDTPMDAWKKALAWLVSPSRPVTPMQKPTESDSLSWAAQCDTLLTKLQYVIDSHQIRTYQEIKAVADRLVSMGGSLALMELTEVVPGQP